MSDHGRRNCHLGVWLVRDGRRPECPFRIRKMKRRRRLGHWLGDVSAILYEVRYHREILSKCGLGREGVRMVDSLFIR